MVILTDFKFKNFSLQIGKSKLNIEPKMKILY